ncbi:ATP synthase subunit I [Candidatus Bipolaricaulota bacterium]|nr:ATP synthase subunit I [Candidatus Bipolaricaulota bacterium]
MFEGVGSINFSKVYPVKLIILSGFLIGEGLFFGLGSSYAFGLWFGLVVSLVVNFLLVYRTSDLVENRDKDDKISRQVSLLAIARFLLYGLALAATALTGWLNFFAAAGGILLPLALLQITVAAKKIRFGGRR